MADTSRADVALAARGLARSRTEAAALIRSGQVRVDGRPVRRPAEPVSATAAVTLDDVGPRYVSRAAHKLVSALDAYPGVRVQGRRVLDAGASTGGFTQVLLARGAARVAAVDVGHGQLASSVRADPRVLVREGLNVRAMTPADVDGPVDLVVSDLSFISLQLVVEPLAAVCKPGADLLLMVKPQFEVGREALPRTGVVIDPDARRDAVAGVAAAALGAGLELYGLARSGLAGHDGNVEFFLWLRRPRPAAAPADGAAAGEDAAPGPDADRAALWTADADVDWA